jgi:hypothetical protein
MMRRLTLKAFYLAKAFENRGSISLFPIGREMSLSCTDLSKTAADRHMTLCKEMLCKSGKYCMAVTLSTQLLEFKIKLWTPVRFSTAF